MYKILTNEEGIVSFNHLPVLDNNNIQKHNFSFTEKNYRDINRIICENPGKKISEYVKIIDFYDFNEESLECALLMFNKFKNSFYNICGPFIIYKKKCYPIFYK